MYLENSEDMAENIRNNRLDDRTVKGSQRPHNKLNSGSKIPVDLSGNQMLLAGNVVNMVTIPRIAAPNQIVMLNRVMQSEISTTSRSIKVKMNKNSNTESTIILLQSKPTNVAALERNLHIKKLIAGAAAKHQIHRFKRSPPKKYSVKSKQNPLKRKKMSPWIQLLLKSNPSKNRGTESRRDTTSTCIKPSRKSPSQA